jgi:hypothetical protein
MLFQMEARTVYVVGQEGAAHATFAPSGAEHEMAHNELAAAFEKIG